MQSDLGIDSDRYEHIGSLGSGGMAVVYKAHDRKLNRFVAIKQVSSENLSDNTVMRFEREARACASLKHPNIVDVFDYGLDDKNRPFIIMDFLEGETLEELIANNKVGDLTSKLEIFIQLLDGLSHAHSKGVVHRDLKPANVMIQKVGGETNRVLVKLMDFGIAKTTLDNARESWQTQTGQLMGSPLYMSPEQTVSSDVDLRSDIYSVGCMLHEVLTGRPPFKGLRWMETMNMHRSQPPSAINKEIQGLEPADRLGNQIQSVVFKALEKDPEARYQNASDLRDALQDIRRELEKRTTGSVDAAKKCARNKIAIALGCITATVILSAGLVKIMDSEVKPQVTEPKKPVTLQDLNKSRESMGMFGGFSQDNWIDSHGTEWELKTDAKYETLPINEVESVSIGRTFDGQSTAKSTQKYKREIKGISSLKRLNRLVIINVDINEDDMKEISTMKTLQEISLEDTPIPRGTVRYLQSLPRLKKVELENVELTKEDAADLIGITKIEKLSLDGNELKDPEILHPVSQLRTLRYLTLSDGGVTDEGVKEISDLPHLYTLKVGGRITLAGITSIAKLWSLKSLSLTMSEIDSRGVKALLALKDLDRLEVEQCKHIDDSCVPLFIQMKKLNVLNIMGTQISDAGIKKLSAACPYLKIKGGTTGAIPQIVPMDQ